MNPQMMKELIARYVDGEVSADEQQRAEQLVAADPAAKAYYEELRRLDGVLNAFPQEDLSPDWEHDVRSSIIREIAAKGETMKTLTRILIRPSVAGLVVGLLAVVVVQHQAQRSLQGRISVADLKKFDMKAGSEGLVIPGLRTRTMVPSERPPVVAAAIQPDAGVTQLVRVEPYEPYYRKAETAEQLARQVVSTPSRESQLASRQNATQTSNVAVDEPYIQIFRGSRVLDVDELKAKSKGGKVRSDVPTAPAASPDIMAVGALALSKERREYDASHYVADKEAVSIGTSQWNTEEYTTIQENAFLAVADNPLSTFSIDVDTASYANLRRYLTGGQLPPVDAVRIEEMINYFTYDYPQPNNKDPFSINIDGTTCPWNPEHKLVRIGLQGKTPAAAELPPSNLVFLIDVSGSMDSADKLPLLKQGFKMMTQQLGANDRVAIVVYAGNAGLVLDTTSGADKNTILNALDRLQAGGSTAGGAGIQLAYKIAQDHFIKGGNNRVILATDGDFNIGVSSTSEMARLIEEKRDEGVFLTVLGFGMGNYKDGRLEQIADKGNGNYYYIDTEREANKVLVSELGSTLFTIAKDVKIQIEFNPAQVKAYRLIGYENRMLAKEDFNDDTKDAGELGAGHTVTALYEIVPADSEESFRRVDELVYQKTKSIPSEDVMTVKFRYKAPDADTSELIAQSLSSSVWEREAHPDLTFAAAVAEFGLILRNSQFKAEASYDHVLSAASASQGTDRFGYRAEFLELVRRAKALDHRVHTLPSTGIQFKNE